MVVSTTKAPQKAVKLRTTDGKGARGNINAECAKDIQSLYRLNRQQAVRLILEGPLTPRPIPREQLQKHFEAAWAERAASTALLTTRLPALENTTHTSSWTRRWWRDS